MTSSEPDHKEPAAALPLSDLRALPDVPADLDALAEFFGELALAAGVDIMRYYGGDIVIRTKADESPVSAADEAAEEVILNRLIARVPGIPVVAEEAAAAGKIPLCGRSFILVDPLDGTREFIARNGEFTVNIALILDGTPVCGAVFAPAFSRLWLGGPGGASVCSALPGGLLPPRAERTPISARKPAPDGFVVLASRSHLDPDTEAYLAQFPIKERRNAGSSLKFCLIAEGEADLYPRFGPTMEWDTAAGDAVLRAAGGRVTDRDGDLLRYGKADQKFRNGIFIARGA